MENCLEETTYFKLLKTIPKNKTTVEKSGRRERHTQKYQSVKAIFVGISIQLRET
jgi:indole-3-glycerol phosphate synthase